MGKKDALENVIGLCFSMIAPILKEIKKDGFQPQDIVAFMDSPDFKAHTETLANDYTQIPDELKNLSLLDDIQLAFLGYKEIKALVDIIK